jgi:hypothetical protein
MKNEIVDKMKKMKLLGMVGNKDSKNDFVQMIYGLHRSGIINAGKGEITKIVT